MKPNKVGISPINCLCLCAFWVPKLSRIGSGTAYHFVAASALDMFHGLGCKPHATSQYRRVLSLSWDIVTRVIITVTVLIDNYL